MATPKDIIPYLGVDLDGTLAYFDEWKGIEHIGAPILPMVERVKKEIAKGRLVKIFTARAADPDAIPFVKKWLVEVAGLPELDVTNAKSWGLEEIWDDIAKQVDRNTGTFALDTVGRELLTMLGKSLDDFN